MAKLLVEGPTPLSGSLVANGAKNAALPIMAASILAQGVTKLTRVPNISDVWVMADILRGLGAKVDFEGKGEMTLDTSSMSTVAPHDLVRQMNASFDVAGPLLACYGHAEVSLPGGCKLGPRPVDLHLMGFEKLGAAVSCESGYVKAKSDKKLVGNKITFPIVSVGATKNCMMAATLAEGVTILENCAKEPEVDDLANFLVAMGAKISGQGTSEIRIQGVERLHGTEYAIVADRIEVGTYLLGAAITKGELTMEQCVPEHLESFIQILRRAGQEVTVYDDAITVKGRIPSSPIEVSTSPYPGFATDLHPQLVTLLALAEGASILNETIFSGRFMYAMELVRLGANIKVNDRQVFIRGVDHFVGAPVDAPDIRAGGALVLAGMAAQGESLISGVRFIDRGYEDIEGRLNSVGAKIKRVEATISHSTV